MLISHKAKKSLGQHFLMHARIAERIALTAQLTPDAVVFEIGPGTGMLTRALLQKARRVIALEVDPELFERLRQDFSEEVASGRLELIQGDLRRFDLTILPRGYVVVANIPYYITGEIFRTFLTALHQPESMTLLVQKEVAERIARSKSAKGARLSGRQGPASGGKESILSLSVKAYGTPKYECTVPRGVFIPPPKVDSAVLTIRNISRKHFTSPKEEKLFFRLLHAGFAHKRKFVRNNLRDAGFSADSIPEKARAEDLPLSAWLALAKDAGSSA